MWTVGVRGRGRNMLVKKVMIMMNGKHRQCGGTSGGIRNLNSGGWGLRGN